jgi:RHS repeat-associated protein
LNTYDVAGNQTGDGLHTYVFNAENQITSMDGGAATYGYDGEGRRMKKVTSSETTYTFYGPGGIISEFTTSNAIASATAAASTDKCLYHTSDKLGSAVLVMNSTGVVIENNRTLPYGEAWLTTDNGTTSTNDKKFTTYQRDAESGLDYAMNRYSASTMGRFTSPDKGRMGLHMPITLNRYLFANADPINNTDPDGKQTITVTTPPPPPVIPESSEFPGGPVGAPPVNFPNLPEVISSAILQALAAQGLTRITVTNFSDSGNKQDLITNVLTTIANTLGGNTDDNCSTWLKGGGSTGSDLIQALLAGNTYGHGSFSNNLVSAFAGQKNADGTPAGVPVTAALTVNDNGAFYNATNSSGQSLTVGPQHYAGGTLQAQAAILIHELAHILGVEGFNQNDAGNPQAGANNDADVDAHCGTLIGGLN